MSPAGTWSAAQAYTAAGLTAGGRSRDLRVPGDRGVRRGDGCRGGATSPLRSTWTLPTTPLRRRPSPHRPAGFFLHYLPAQAGNRRGCLPGLTRDHPGRTGGDERCCGRFCSRRSRHRSAIRRRVPGAGDLHTAEPAIPGVWLPTGPTPPIGTCLGGDDAVGTRLGGSVPAGRPARARQQEVGARLQRGEGDRRQGEHTPAPPSRPRSRSSGNTRLRRSTSAWCGSVADQPGRDITRNARLFAAAAGRAIATTPSSACFDAKYQYNFWRPVAAIQATATPTATRPPRARPTGNAARRRPNAPRVPERALVPHPCERARHRPVPGYVGDRLHDPEPDRPGRPALRACRATLPTTSATPASGAGSTSARRSRTASRSPGRRPTTCSPTTSRSRVPRQRSTARAPLVPAPWKHGSATIEET